MTKEMIRHKYRYESTVSYQWAVAQLLSLGFNEFSADQFIWADYN